MYLGVERYLLLRCDSEHSVDEGSVGDELQPGVAEAGRNAGAYNAQRMTERGENLSERDSGSNLTSKDQDTLCKATLM